MSEDPKYTLKKIIDNISIKKDDNVTNATLVFLYHGGPETLKELFADYDVVVMIDDARATGIRQMQEVPEHHPEMYPVHVLTVDKYALVLGVHTLVCTATKMDHKMKEQMRAVVEAAGISAGFRLRITDERPDNKRVGGLMVWETTYSILYTDV